MGLREELMKLIKEHGVEAVRDETLKILRREMLVAATAKYILMPHRAEDASIKGRRN